MTTVLFIFILAMEWMSLQGYFSTSTSTSFQQVVTDQHPHPHNHHQHNQHNQHHCWSPCPHGRINKVVYTCPFQAGLKDRLFIFHQLLNIAGFLCAATVHVPQPHVLLSAAHNHQIPLDDDSLWSDYVNLTWAMNGQPALFELQQLGSNSNSNSHNNNLGQQQHPSPSSKSKKSNGYNFWQTIDPEQTLADFHSLIAHSQEQPDQPFIWQIDAYWWMSSLQRQGVIPPPDNNQNLTLAQRTAFPTNPHHFLKKANQTITSGSNSGSNSGCVYYQERDPDHLVEIATRLWQRELADLVNDESSSQIIGFFHLRRGDGIPECNTTLAKLRSYFNCSFHGLWSSPEVVRGQNKNNNNKNITLLLGTDEQDVTYLEALQLMVTEHFPHVRLFMHLKDLAWAYVRDSVERGVLPKRFLNNFYIFRIEDRIRRHPDIAFRLSQRRTIACNDCDSVIEQLTTLALK
jgi:hypothetical protein